MRMGKKLDHHALRDVRRWQEGDGGIGGRERQHQRSHVDVRGQRRVADQAHFRFAGSAGGEIENGRIFGANFGADLLERLRIFLQRGAALGVRSCSSVRALSDSPVSKIQCNPASVSPPSAAMQRLHALRIFHENRFGVAGADTFLA